MKLHIECPACWAELNAETDPNLGRVRCINCGAEFTPAKALERNRIERRAEVFCSFGFSILILGFLIVFGSICSAIEGDGAIGGFITGGAMLGAGFWLYLIGQIMHIRANTLKC